MPRLPYAHELHRALSQAHLADRGDRRTQARGRERRSGRSAVNYRSETALWIAQRTSAAVLALCVTVHLVTIVYAVRGGLTAAEIFARTRGNAGWLAFYVVFVLAVAVHAPIGLRPVLTEWLGWRGRSRDLFALLFGLLLMWTGMRAVLGVYS